MSVTLLYSILIILGLIALGKWVMILLIYPFQVCEGLYRRKNTLVLKVLAAPYIAWEHIFRGGWTRYMLYNVGRIPSHHFRRFIYRSLGLQMGKNVVFHYGTEIREITKLKIGDGSIIGDNAILDARRSIIIGDNVCLASNVSIWTLQHDHRSPDFACRPEGGIVEIHDRAWIGCNVIILPGVTIGEGAVCCAGCVVTKDVEPYTVVAGIPAIKVNERPRNLNYTFDGRSCRLL